MDYKKEYEEMVQRARELHKGGNALTKQQMEIVCPELAESEDEKIRKKLIKTIGYFRSRGIDQQLCEEFIAYLEKQKEQKPAVYTPKFKVGDKVISTGNTHLTYDILEVGLINELGKPDYRVEIFKDEQSDTPPNIKLIECQKMDKWGKLIEQKPVEWGEKDRKMLEVISYKISQRQGNDERSLFTPDEAEFMCEIEDKLKSRPQWKPSEEQMKALICAIEECGYNSGLESLYNDLKKL